MRGPCLELWTLGSAQGDEGRDTPLTAALDVLDLLGIAGVEACDFAA